MKGNNFLVERESGKWGSLGFFNFVVREGILKGGESECGCLLIKFCISIFSGYLCF